VDRFDNPAGCAATEFLSFGETGDCPSFRIAGMVQVLMSNSSGTPGLIPLTPPADRPRLSASVTGRKSCPDHFWATVRAWAPNSHVAIALCICTVQKICVFLAGVKDGDFDDLVVVKNPAPGCADAPRSCRPAPARVS